MTQRVAGKVAIVTGAGSGIGAASARALAREGARVVLTDIALAPAALVVDDITAAGGIALALAHDVGAEAGWAGVIEATLNAFGKLDVLVNNAGVAARGALIDTSLEEWRALMRVNLDGVFLGTRAAVGAMQSIAGRPADHPRSAINLSSILWPAGWACAAAARASQACGGPVR